MTDASRALGPAGAEALTRREIVTGVVAVGLINGFAARAIPAIRDMGWMEAVFGTFDVSAIVWVSCAILLKILWAMPAAHPKRWDMPVSVLCLAAFLVPVGQASWLALTLFAVYLAITSAPRSDLRRAALLLAAITLPMMWGSLLIKAFSGPLLAADATLAGALIGVQAVQNTVPFADGSGTLWIAPACSSALAVSLAILCGVAFVVGNGLSWSWRMTGTMLGVIVIIIAINTVRLAAIALFPAYYYELHGPLGGTAVTLLMLAVMVGIFWIATQRERAPAA